MRLGFRYRRECGWNSTIHHYGAFLDFVVGSTVGRFAARLERSGQAASVEFLVEHLRAVFGSSITSCLSDRVITTTWQGDPWTLGAYSAARPGQAHQRAVLARPVDGRLFFAGAATSREFFCTCHGAYLTGIAHGDVRYRTPLWPFTPAWMMIPTLTHTGTTDPLH